MSLTSVVPDETALESGGHGKGVAAAIVRENRDDSGLGRVKVSYPWHSQPRDSYWARVAVPMAGRDRGTYFIPENGDEVLVAFDRGDLRFPYVIGCLWNGADKAPLANADGKNDVREIRSRKGHRLTFDDGDRVKVELQLKDGKRVTLDDDGIELDDGRGNRVVIESAAGAVTIQAATKLTLRAPQVVVESSGNLDLRSNANLTLRGTLVSIN